MHKSIDQRSTGSALIVICPKISIVEPGQRRPSDLEQASYVGTRLYSILPDRTSSSESSFLRSGVTHSKIPIAAEARAEPAERR